MTDDALHHAKLMLTGISEFIGKKQTTTLDIMSLALASLAFGLVALVDRLDMMIDTDNQSIRTTVLK